MKMQSLVAALLLLAIAPAAHADRPPPPPKEPAYPLVIEAGPKVLEGKLIIPRKMLGQLKGGLDGDERQYGMQPRTHTIIAGISLALALTFGGLWLVRRGTMGGRALALLLGTMATLGIAATVMADLRPDPRPEVQRTDKIIIEVTEQGDAVKLIVNKAKLAKALEEKK